MFALGKAGLTLTQSWPWIFALYALPALVALAVVWRGVPETRAVESVGYAASIPAERAFVADIAGEDTRGTSYGLYTFAYFLGALVGPIAGGWLYDTRGHATPFYLNSAVLLFGALLVVLMLRESRRGESARAGAVI